MNAKKIRAAVKYWKLWKRHADSYQCRNPYSYYPDIGTVSGRAYKRYSIYGRKTKSKVSNSRTENDLENCQKRVSTKFSLSQILNRFSVLFVSDSLLEASWTDTLLPSPRRTLPLFAMVYREKLRT